MPPAPTGDTTSEPLPATHKKMSNGKKERPAEVQACCDHCHRLSAAPGHVSLLAGPGPGTGPDSTCQRFKIMLHVQNRRHGTAHRHIDTQTHRHTDTQTLSSQRAFACKQGKWVHRSAERTVLALARMQNSAHAQAQDRCSIPGLARRARQLQWRPHVQVWRLCPLEPSAPPRPRFSLRRTSTAGWRGPAPCTGDTHKLRPNWPLKPCIGVR